MIEDAAWLAAKATLPAWCVPRISVLTETVYLEWDLAEFTKGSNDPADVRAEFFRVLGGEWLIVERMPRFKTMVTVYRRMA